MSKKIFFIITFCLLINILSFAQLKSVYDSKYKKFNIGFKIEVPASQKIKVVIYNQDSSFCKVLIDSNFSKNKSVVFLFDKCIESEKHNFTDDFVIPIPNVVSGLYYIEMYIKEKFFITK